MLKRQRSSSPTAVSQIDTCISQNPSAGMPQTKRRRLLSLHSIFHLETLPASMSNQLTHDYDVCEASSALVELMKEDRRVGQASVTAPIESNYKSSNSLLHELHILHHHRQMFTRATPQESSKITGGPENSITHVSANAEGFHTTEHYCCINRFIGGLFMSRRRQQDC